MQSSPASDDREPQARDAAAEPDELIAELAQLEDRYKRALADLDNYRKRSAQEIQRRTAEVRVAVLRDWLDVVDSAERAVRLDSAGPCAEGFQAMLEQMDAVLARQGVTRFGAAGEAFDPEVHEAVAVHASEAVPDRTVLEVARSGYAIGERVIRPAQVVVARTPERAH